MALYNTNKLLNETQQKKYIYHTKKNKQNQIKQKFVSPAQNNETLRCTDINLEELSYEYYLLYNQG